MPAAFQFRCRTCDAVHEGIPSFGADAPQAYAALPEAERSTRALLSRDQCVIDGQHSFVRGCLEVPVHGQAEPLVWGVWVALGEDDFAHMAAAWNEDGRERAAPYAGTLDTQLPGYPATRGLSVALHTEARGKRPRVVLAPSPHPLAIAQASGIDEARLTAIVERALHPPPHEPCATVLAAHVAAWGEADDAIVFDESTRPIGAQPPLAYTSVWIWRATDADDVTTFLTVGMSARPLPHGAAHRAELHMGVRGVLARDDEGAIAAFLANLACYPWDADQLLDFWHALPSGLPIPAFPRCTALLLRPAFFDEGLDCLSTAEGKVHVLHVVPITAEERVLARSGLDALFAHWEDADVDLLADRSGSAIATR